MTLAGVVSSFAGGLWRRGRKAFVWHGLVAVVGLAASWGFSVTQSGPVSELDRDDRPLHSDVEDPDQEGGGACHSGGDSDECIGG